MKALLLTVLSLLCAFSLSPALAANHPSGNDNPAGALATLSQLPSHTLADLKPLSSHELARVEGQGGYYISNSVKVYQSNSCYGYKCQSYTKVTKCNGYKCRTYQKSSKCYGYCSNKVKVHQCSGYGCGKRRKSRMK